MEKRAQTRSEHCQSPPCSDHYWAQALSTLSSSQPPSVSPAADSVQTCGWMWKVLIVSIYFLFQTLGILTFIIRFPFMAPVRKITHVNRFYFQRKYDIMTQWRQQWGGSSPVSAGTGQWMREENTGQGGESGQWAGVGSLPTSSRYANRSTDTFRCRCRKGSLGIWRHKVGRSTPTRQLSHTVREKNQEPVQVGHVRAHILNSPPHAHMSHSKIPTIQCVPSAPTPLPI